MAPLERVKRVNLKVNEAEHDMLQALADREGVSMSDYIRQHIRRAHRETFGEQPTKPRKSKR